MDGDLSFQWTAPLANTATFWREAPPIATTPDGDYIYTLVQSSSKRPERDSSTWTAMKSLYRR
jgi:hypothetical protein